MKKILFILIILLLNGCYNYKELNEFAYTSSISIDKLDNNYIISLQIINIKKKEENKPNYIIYKGKGKTIEEAFKDLSKTISKIIYLNSNEIMIISKDLAKESIYEIISFFNQKNDINKLMYLVISNNTDEILNITSKLDYINTNKIKEILKINNMNKLTFEEVTNNYLNNKYYLLPSIYIENNNIKLGSLCLLKKDKLINCFLNKKESNNG